MENFLERIAKLPHKRLALLASELYEQSRSTASEPIAITAIACRFPGGGETPEEFWSFLQEGGDAIQSVPDSRLGLISRLGSNGVGGAPIWGGFLGQVDCFDPTVFGISAKEAEMMDPQQRLLLEVTWEALENAGTPIDALDTDTGVFIGVSGIDFALLSLEAEIEPNGYLLTGASHAVIAGRLSYIFGLNGPSTVLDTACAASASAIHLGCQSLRARECNQVIAGGINLMLIPEMAEMLATLQVMARDGRCKVFSAEADGFVRAEGCGVIVLRRLSDAIARRDPILGVIRGTAWNQDGKSGGLTAPNGAAQERVIRAALADAKLSPDQISYVEAHGTGTALGDPIELSALGRVFTTSTRETPLVIGSVKANIGHLEAAAGMASIIKVLLALRHGMIPPHLHASTLNPRIDWASLPLRIPTQGAAWPKAAEPRFAGVSAFGISGTNVHMVISDPPAQIEEEALTSRSSTLLALSAKSREALQALALRYANALARRRDVDIAAFAAAANCKRAHFAHRLALFAEDAGAAESALRAFGQNQVVESVHTAFVGNHRPQIGMDFGDARLDGTGLAPFLEEPAFRAAYDEWRSAISAGTLGRCAEAVGRQIALVALWRAWGIEPVLALGEGSGEIAAAAAAGALSLRDAAALAASVDAGIAPPPLSLEPLRISLSTGSLGDRMAGRPLPASCLATIGRVAAAATSRGQADRTVDRVIAMRASDRQHLLAELAAVYLAGVAVDWAGFHDGQRLDAVLLPNYPFQRKRFWPAEFAVMRKRPRDHEKGASRALKDGLYRVEWRAVDAERVVEDPQIPASGGPRAVFLLHRGADESSAISALEAAGLHVRDILLGDSPLRRSDIDAWMSGAQDAAVLYLAAGECDDPDPLGASHAALEDVLVIAQAMAETGAAGPAVYVATRGTQSPGATAPADAALWGLGRVLAAEAPDARLSLIELATRAPDWTSLAEIIASGRSEAELAIIDGQKSSPTLVPVELPAGTSERLASPEASYIVTGAFGFIGEITTRWLVQQGAGKLFLVGRNPPRKEALSAIEVARAGGTEVETIIADIGTAEGANAIFQRVEADSRPLKGIVHSAAALDDASIGRQSPDTLARALGPKARGAWLLHERSLRHTLDFFVLYSSAAALLGTPGQANYAAANCYLDALAHHRRLRGLPALSVNWGLWVSTGLAVKREVVQSGAAQGAVPITSEIGMAVLGRAISSGESQVVVLPLDWALLRQTLETRRPPTLLRALLTTSGGVTSDTPASGGLLATYVASFKAASTSERGSLLVDFTRRRSAELLRLDPGFPIPDDQPLLDLGLDSLVGLELRNNLQMVAGMKFPSTLFFECPTVADLAIYFRLIFPEEEKAEAKATEQAYERIVL
jgi:acyl transferase domain-containing protein/acyl carrier protein